LLRKSCKLKYTPYLHLFGTSERGGVTTTLLHLDVIEVTGIFEGGERVPYFNTTGWSDVDATLIQWC